MKPQRRPRPEPDDFYTEHDIALVKIADVDRATEEQHGRLVGMAVTS